DVVGRTPKDTSGQWARVTQLDARQAGAPTDHLTSFLVQLDIYAGGQGQVWTNARTIRQALHEMPAAEHDAAVVTGVTFTGMARVPDTTFETARERVVLTAEIFAHPA